MAKKSSYKNRMEVTETFENPERIEPPQKIRLKDSQCPKCGAEGIVVSELMRNDKVQRERRCPKCNIRYVEGA